MLRATRRHVSASFVIITTLFAAILFVAAPAQAASVGYRVEFVNGFGCHVVQANLGSPGVKVTPIVSLSFPGGAEPMMTMCGREQPSAAVTGTFFSKTNLLPVGDIVIDGRLEYFGGMGSAIAITPDNRVVFQRLPYGRRQDWGEFETVLACGPMLLERGRIALAPTHERFRDPHVLGRASRVAVGLTAQNKLLMVATREQVSLWELAKMMSGLGCIDAINLDGGTSTGMYYQGRGIIKPGRSLVNMLAVHENVPTEARTCERELPSDRDCISRYRSAQAYNVYMQAQTPLAKGNLDEAVRLLHKAAGLEPTNASYQVRLAETLDRRGDARAAAAAWARAGEILLDKCLYEDAADRFRLALERAPDNVLAQRGLPAAYRGMGLSARAEAAEYTLALWGLESALVASHTSLMNELVTRAYALARLPAPRQLPGPSLLGEYADDVYRDPMLRDELRLPPSWSFMARNDLSALTMRHRFRPWMGHLRVAWAPPNARLESLVDMYWERSFQEVERAPVLVGLPSQPIWRTQTISTSPDSYTDTRFVLRDDTLWVLSMTTTPDQREAASSDFRQLADGFTML